MNTNIYTHRKKVLVTGGAGFIGSHLCEYLLGKGFEVICVDSLVTGNKNNIACLLKVQGFRFVRHDITKPINVGGHLDYVLNFASPASPVDYMDLPLETLETGSVGTRNMLELARQKKAVFVQASTSEVYGDPLVHPQKETYLGNVNPVGPRSVYDEAKRFAEAITMAYRRFYGSKVKIIRIFNTYGPRMRLNDGRVVPNLIGQALKGIPMTVYGNGLQTRSFCYVSDLVDGIFRMMVSGETGPVNLGNPEEMTILDFARLIRRLSESESRIVFRKLPTGDPRMRKPDISLARKKLGWKIEVGIEDGLKRTIDWFRRRIK